jgi:hypothetical protein
VAWKDELIEVESLPSLLSIAEVAVAREFSDELVVNDVNALVEAGSLLSLSSTGELVVANVNEPVEVGSISSLSLLAEVVVAKEPSEDELEDKSTVSANAEVVNVPRPEVVLEAESEMVELDSAASESGAMVEEAFEKSELAMTSESAEDEVMDDKRAEIVVLAAEVVEELAEL